MNWLNLNTFKKTRQNWIYGVFSVVLGIFVYNGLFFLLPLLAFFYVRFPKNYWIFLLVFGASFVWLHFATNTPMAPYLTGEHERYTAEIIRVRRRTEERQTAIIEINDKRVFMTFHETYPPLIPGQSVEIVGRLAPATESTVPYRFNFREFLEHQRIYLTLHTSELTILNIKFSPWRFQYDIADWVRDTFPPLTASYLQSFFLGIRDDIDEATMDIYGDLGILHVFAISGTHVTLLAGMIRDALKRMGLIDLIVDGVIILFCLVFIFATGGSVSVIRACAMAILAIGNRRFKLGLSSFDIFSIIFIGNFILNPQVVYQSGFQFSYWIAFVLICSRAALRPLSPLHSRLTIVFLARMAAIPLSAAASYEINLTSYLANLLLVPFLMQIIFPALLVTLFLPFLSPITDFLLRSFQSVNSFLHPFLNTHITFGAVSLPITLLLMVLLLTSCYFYEKYKKLWIRLALIGMYILILEANRIRQPYTTITFLDVGQGDATIIRSPHQACTVVIDTGGDVSRIHSHNPSIFSHTLEPYLLGAGVRNVDFLILTHEHYDHIAEAIPLMNRFNVQNIILSKAEHDQQMQTIVAKAQKLHIPVHLARPLDTFTCGNQTYTFIHDQVDHLDINENSLVMTVEIDGFNVLLTGDIGHVTEPVILENNHLPQIDLYHVAHHGSRYSNSLAFMNALNIRYAVVQAGQRNFYGHPHAKLFEVIDELSMPLLNTIEHGTVQFKLRNTGYQIHIWPPDSSY